MNENELYYVDFDLKLLKEKQKEVLAADLLTIISDLTSKLENKNVFDKFELNAKQLKLYKNCGNSPTRIMFFLKLNSKQEIFAKFINQFVRDQYFDEYPELFTELDFKIKYKYIIDNFKPKVTKKDKLTDEFIDQFNKQADLFSSISRFFLNNNGETLESLHCQIILKEEQLKLEEFRKENIIEEKNKKIANLENKTIVSSSKSNQKLNEANQKLENDNKKLINIIDDKDKYINELESKYKEINDSLEILKSHNGYISKQCVNKDEKAFLDTVLNNSKVLHLDYSLFDIANFHIALKSSPLVILAGSSGTGKTQLPLVYAKTLNMDEDNKHLLFIPISPSYTEPSDVLGYLKPNINNDNNDIVYDGTFIESQTGLVSFLLEAEKNRDELFMVVFDEMNLSQIEYWFSPFMSILERNEEERKLVLYSNSVNCSNKDKIPSSIKLGNNVLFVGTINLDETTKEMSDRLIDRAIVVNLEQKNVEDYFNIMKYQDNNKIINVCDNNIFFNFRNNVENYITVFNNEEIKFFSKMNNYINGINNSKELSFRTLKNIANYINNSNSIISREDALDVAIKETIIMKIKGSDESIRVLLSDENGIKNILDEFTNISSFKRCRDSINKKLNELNIYGYTR